MFVKTTSSARPSAAATAATPRTSRLDSRPVGSGRAPLQQQFPRLPFLWLDTAGSEGEVFALTLGELAGLK